MTRVFLLLLFPLLCEPLFSSRQPLVNVSLFILNPRRYLVFIPGYGGDGIIKTSLSESLIAYPPTDWDCIVVFHVAGLNHSFPNCHMIENINGKYAEHLKLLNPEFIVRRKYSLVVVHLEDVVFQSPRRVPWQSLENILISEGIGAVSPRVRGASHTHMNPSGARALIASSCPGLNVTNASRRPLSACQWYGFETEFIEIYATVFQPSAWTCFWDMIDTSLNNEGWGYDVCFKTICGWPLYVMDDWYALHSRASKRNDIAPKQLRSWALHRSVPKTELEVACPELLWGRFVRSGR
jgi:Protein of unknown function (DUF707)